MARRVIRTEYVDDDAAQPRVTEVVEPAPAPRRRTTYIEDEGPYVAGTRSYGGPAWGMPVGVMIGLAVVAFLLLMLLLGHV